jgi:hypothetical protein
MVILNLHSRGNGNLRFYKDNTFSISICCFILDCEKKKKPIQKVKEIIFRIGKKNVKQVQLQEHFQNETMGSQKITLYNQKITISKCV